jgi:4-amino-4-deoxy-L-arabinose transferase-like glycosyltransferase
MAEPEPSMKPPRGVALSPVAVLVGIVALAVALRTSYLLSLFPILVDESIYLRWAEIIDHQGQWFVSLLDGKQPFSYWLYALLRKCLPDIDPLLGARSVSVVAGAVATALLFDLGRRLAGTFAGLAAALFYALLPYGVFYDRLAYTDALVNCFGLAIAVASIRCFREGLPTRTQAAVVGALLGLGMFTKTTVAPFALVPAAAALLWQRDQPGLAGRGLVQIYAIAALLPALSYFVIPKAPNFAISDPFLHHTSFFTPLGVLSADPFVNAGRNGILLADYLHHYVTPMFAAGALASVVYLAAKREPTAALAAAAFIVPVTLQVVVLEYFPSRYVFPHMWPLTLATAVAVDRVSAGIGRAAASLATGCLAISLGVGTTALLYAPQKQLHWIDAGEFLSSGPFSGYGIREAIEYLKREAAQGPLTVLTDPTWGTPADAIYPYLNRRYGIRVYDAWWTQLSDREPLLPIGRREVMKSQYERVTDGFVDFDRLPRVVYITDTNYQTPADVHRRQPQARLMAKFPKRNGYDSVDVYQLR